MTSATVSTWSRAFVAVGITFFAVWQVAFVAGFGRRTVVALGLYGFVFCVVFGKAYALIPSYFARELSVAYAPAIHLPLAVFGIGGFVADSLGFGSPLLGTLGATFWFLGCLVFVATLGWTIRDNLTGRETGTGEVNAHRRRVDRASNAGIPIALSYLVIGASIPVLEGVGLETTAVLSGQPPVTHILAAGTGALLVFTIGFRLLPRFLVVTPRPVFVAIVLPAGALAPALLAVDFLGGTVFRLGSALQALAIGGFAIAYFDMYVRSERRRVGFYAVGAGALCGIGAVVLGLQFAFVSLDGAAIEAHYRLALAGFLGLTIVGVTYQFYPPAIGSMPGVDDRTALASIGLLFGGLVIETGGLIGQSTALERIGSLTVAIGALWYAYIVLSVFVERR